MYEEWIIIDQENILDKFFSNPNVRSPDQLIRVKYMTPATTFQRKSFVFFANLCVYNFPEHSSKFETQTKWWISKLQCTSDRVLFSRKESPVRVTISNLTMSARLSHWWNLKCTLEDDSSGIISLERPMRFWRECSWTHLANSNIWFAAYKTKPAIRSLNKGHWWSLESELRTILSRKQICLSSSRF